MTSPVERKLLGDPIPGEQLVAQWEDLHHRNLTNGAVASLESSCCLLCWERIWEQNLGEFGANKRDVVKQAGRGKAVDLNI